MNASSVIVVKHIDFIVNICSYQNSIAYVLNHYIFTQIFISHVTLQVELYSLFDYIIFEKNDLCLN
jgi:hypothetical protein